MSKFIKVQLEFNNEWLLLNAGEIIEISMDNDGYTKITMKGGSYVVHQKMEQIEAQLLRDEFAMAALNGLLASGEKISRENTGMYSRHAAQLAHKAGVYADAMLKERLK